MQVKCLKVKAKDGENVLEKLRKLDLRLSNFKISKEGNYLLIPVKPSADLNSIKLVSARAVDIVESDLQAKSERKNLVENLKVKLPGNLQAHIPRSFDIIGHAAIISLPQPLESHALEIGQTIVETHKNVKTVLAKQTSIEGEHRLRKYRLIAGENKTETIHRENGCRFLVDVTKAYFNPRLSNEHYRIAKSVKDEEIIVDMFTGVGPFSILIAKLHKNIKVYAIDSNPDAIYYLKKNLSLNKVEDKIIPYSGDAKIVVPRIGKADRVIMNLPEHSIEYIDSASKILSKNGVVHYYSFIREPDPELKALEEVSKAFTECGRKGRAIFSKAIREVAPRTWMVAVDYESQD